MSNRGRATPKRNRRLTLIRNDPTPDESPAGEDERLIELREMLAQIGAPAELLRLLDEPGGPEQAVQQVIDSGLMPSPQEVYTEMIDGFRSLLKRGTSQLDAELAGTEFLGMVHASAPDPDDVQILMAGLIAQAEEYGEPEALAMLRIVGAIGPTEVRAEATNAAERLIATGLADPPWVNGLGAPNPQGGFGYIDMFGAQEAILIAFSYGRKHHAMCVLLDHELGGGIKDCFPTDKAARVRAEYKATARQMEVNLDVYDAAEVHAILDRALRKPPCPQLPDQVEDIGVYLDLLRRRVALLPPADVTAAHVTAADLPAAHLPAADVTLALGADVTAADVTLALGADVTSASGADLTPAPGAGLVRQRPAPAGKAGPTVHRLKISLRGSRPPIWRRLEVPSSTSLSKLHDAIQAAFGWEDCHMWVFQTPQGEYGLPDPELGHRSAAAKKLQDVARAGGRISYTYDFGDNWDHEILVEEVLDAEPGVAYPRCVAGRRATPPEDCGGVWGYQRLLEILKDPTHEEHADRLVWLGLDAPDELDPTAFDLDEVNSALSAMAKVVVKP